MPAYDFRCNACQHTFTLTFANIQQMEQAEPLCPVCQSDQLSRLIRRVAVLTSEEKRLERLADPSRLAAVEDDPRAAGRVMSEMANELGEDAGPEMREIAERQENGESPASVERSLTSGSSDAAGSDV